MAWLSLKGSTHLPRHDIRSDIGRIESLPFSCLVGSDVLEQFSTCGRLFLSWCFSDRTRRPGMLLDARLWTVMSLKQICLKIFQCSEVRSAFSGSLCCQASLRPRDCHGNVVNWQGQGGISARRFIWSSAAFLRVSRGLGHQISFLLLSPSSLLWAN